MRAQNYKLQEREEVYMGKTGFKGLGKRMLSVVMAAALTFMYMPSELGVKKAGAQETHHAGYTGLTTDNAWKDYHTSFSKENGIKDGNYYLESDINETKAGYTQGMCAIGEVKICMNGHTLSVQNDGGYSAVSTSQGDNGSTTANIVLEDCKGGAAIESKKTDGSLTGYGISVGWDLEKGFELNCDISISAREGIRLLGGSKFYLGGDINFNTTACDFEINNYKEHITPIILTKAQNNSKPYKIDFYKWDKISASDTPVKITENWSEYMGNKNVTDYYVSKDSKYTVVCYEGEVAITTIDKAKNYPTYIKGNISADVNISGWKYSERAKEPSAVIKSGGNDITSYYNKDVIKYTYYKDSSCTEKTTEEEGAASEGAVPAYAGTYYVKAEIPDTEGYNAGTSKAAEFTIAPKEIGIKWHGDSFVYNGEMQVPHAETTDVAEGDDCEIIVSGGQTDTNRKSGIASYKAEAECTNKNYSIREQDKIVDFTIEPKSIEDAEITLAPGDEVHTGETITQSIGSVVVDGNKLTADDYEIDNNSSVIEAKDFGTYTINLNGIGNYTDSVSVKWRIKDDKNPMGNIVIDENIWTSFLNDITFGQFFKETKKVTIKASDEGSGVDKIYYYTSNEKLSKDKVEELADDKWTEIENGGNFSLDNENNYVVYAKITDKSGNITYISSNGFAIDKTAPKVEGAEDGKTYCVEREITVTDSNLKSVTVNEKDIPLTEDNKCVIELKNTKEDGSESGQAYTILAEDKAGNKTEIKVTMNKEHKVVPYENIEATCTKDGRSGGSYCSVCGEVIEEPKIIPELGHDMPDDWKTEREATKSEDGLKSKTCKREGCGYKMYESIPFDAASDTGSINKYAEVAPDAPIENALIENKKNELVSAESKIFTDAEKEQIVNGTSAKVWLEITKTDETKISQDDKTKVQEKAVEAVGNGAKISYFDADLFSQIQGTSKKKISEPGVAISVKVKIPNELLNHNSTMVRQYKIIRLHIDDAGNSSIEVIGGEFNANTKEFTFKTDKFSTYALAYNDVKNGSGYVPGTVLPEESVAPTTQPSVAPTSGPVISAEPTAEPTKEPEITKEPEPTAEPTKEPEITKEPQVTVEPTKEPTVTVKPTKTPAVKDQSKLTGREVSKLKLPILLAKGKGENKKIKISWASYKGASGYDCYWSYCDGKQNFKKFASVKGTKNYVIHKNLKNNREYKYFVAAYKIVNGKKVYIARSNQLHVAMKADKKTNAKVISVNKTKITLKKGKTFSIKNSVKLENTGKKQLLHANEYRYYTSNKNVAVVSKQGKIKAVKKGKCVIYVLANNGVYKKIKITVK